MKKESTQTLTTAIVRYIKSNGGRCKAFTSSANRLYNPKDNGTYNNGELSDKILFIEVKARQGGDQYQVLMELASLPETLKILKKWYDKLTVIWIK